MEKELVKIPSANHYQTYRVFEPKINATSN